MKLQINRTGLIGKFVCYVTVAYIEGNPHTFNSVHNRTGMSDEQAKTAFEREHFREVGELIAQHMQRQLQPQLN